MLNQNPSELARGLVAHYSFSSPSDIAEQGGTVTGSLRYDAVKGAYFNGSAYVQYPVRSQLFNGVGWSCVIEFTPGFEANDGIAHYFYYSSLTMRLFKFSSNALTLRCGTAGTISVALADYQTYWKTNQRNVITLHIVNGAVAIRLNGNLLVASGGVAAAAEVVSALIIGASAGGATPFLGSIHSLKFFRHSAAAELLTAQEAIDYTNRSTYTYQNRATCILPMGAAQHDAAGARTLDVSGKGNHFTFGNGVTGTTFPTKLATRGYSFDNGDWLRLPIVTAANYSCCALVMRAVDGNATVYGSDNVGYGLINATSGSFSASPSGTKYIDGKPSNGVPGIGSYRFYVVVDLPITTTNYLYLGQRGAGINRLIGSIYYFSLYPFALTPTQVIAEYIEARKGLNDV